MALSDDSIFAQDSLLFIQTQYLLCHQRVTFMLYETKLRQFQGIIANFVKMSHCVRGHPIEI